MPQVSGWLTSFMLRAMDTKATWMNVISSLTPVNARVPMHFPTDREALATAMQTTARTNPKSAKALWIKNTLSCQALLASEAYLDDASGRADLAVQSKPAQLTFDERGDLRPVF
jgi:hypothetical protein